jgi:ubiquinone/menaquinone biosynthesis C-methylase UbiE
MNNVHPRVVDGFGKEWQKFDHAELEGPELQSLFEQYFSIFPWSSLPPEATGFDLGCGTGRWAHFVAKRVAHLDCIDASAAAIEIARRNLRTHSNCSFYCASVEAMPLPDGSADFGYSLGVLHHVPNTEQGIRECARKLKPGAPLLLYLYYAFDNRPRWFRAIWRLSDLIRRVISALPFVMRSPVCDLIAAVVYWPFARVSKLIEKLGVKVDHVPLSAYRNRRFYSMRTDALDRFGTRVEKRFTRQQIRWMMEAAGLGRIAFSEMPYWCAVGYRTSELKSEMTSDQLGQ